MVTSVSVITPLIASVAGFFVTKRYWHSKVFGLSYLALSLGMLMNALGEVVYYILQQKGFDMSVPQLNDAIFLSFYPLTFFHLARNIKFFKPKISAPIKILITILPISVAGVYVFLEYGQSNVLDENFFVGLAYIVGSAVIFSASILGALIFRQGILGTPWLILALGIALTTLADNWYSYLNLYNQYTETHLVNLLWYAGYLVVAYALYKHKDVV